MTGRRTHDAILTAPSTVYPGGSINERERERGGCVLERVVCRVRFARVSCPWLRFGGSCERALNVNVNVMARPGLPKSESLAAQASNSPRTPCELSSTRTRRVG